MEKTEEKKERFVFKDLGDELLIYDSQSDNAHFLNGTAKLVFELIQKNCSFDEIEEEIRKATSTGRPFGSIGFIEHVERVLGRQLKPKKGGRPKKAK